MTLTGEQQAVAEENDAFYDALNKRDLTAMDRLWFPAEWVECVHPGMAPIRGWDAVRESWSMLFSAAGSLLVAATGGQIRVVGEGAWGPCGGRMGGLGRRPHRDPQRRPHGLVAGARDECLRPARWDVADGSASRVLRAVP